MRHDKDQARSDQRPASLPPGTARDLLRFAVDTLRGIFEVAIEHGLISRNPAAGIQKVKVPQKKLELPSAEQFRQIVEVMRKSGSAFSDGCADLTEFLSG